jgi:phospholipid/cholesterol/gamma-HCH transport system permease protein
MATPASAHSPGTAEKHRPHAPNPISEWIQASGGFAALLFRSLYEFFTFIFPPKQYFFLTLEQLLALGFQSLPLIAVTGIAIGSVMALQFGYGLQRFGGTNYVPMLVGLAVLRELGPVLTSLLLAGRVGSGITSEIASMSVTQQVDALRALATSPYSMLVVPRILTCLIAFPLLGLFADYIAIASSMLICHQEFGMNFEFYLSKTVRALTLGDYLTGVGKTVVFGLMVSVTACWKGLNTTGGTKGVGFSTTWVVVVSSILILISDLVLSKIFILLGFYQ